MRKGASGLPFFCARRARRSPLQFQQRFAPPIEPGDGMARPSSASEGLSPEPTVALCRGCDYPLRGLSENRRPECGRPFDPTDPTTMNFGRPIGRLGRLLLRPIGWPTVALGLL